MLYLTGLSLFLFVGEIICFTVPQSTQLLRLSTSGGVGPHGGGVCMMLPESKKFDGDEVKNSLKRFVDSAPQGIWHMVEKKVVPAAKAVIMKELNKNKPSVEEATERDVEVRLAESQDPTSKEEKVGETVDVVAEVPDSSETMAKLRALLDRSVAEELEDFEYSG